MYLSRLSLDDSRSAVLWVANPYRVHQRLKMAFEGDPHLLFRIEENPGGTQILVQSQTAPHWEAAFRDLPVLRTPPEQKPFDLVLEPGQRYRFRLLANPTVKKTIDGAEGPRKTRRGLLNEEAQIAWLVRKLSAAGAVLVGGAAASRGFQKSHRNPAQDTGMQTHFTVVYEGVLRVEQPDLLRAAIVTGIGSAKGYGFGLLSLAPV